MAETAPGGLHTVDEAADPHLSGRFAPVNRETDADDLRVEGTLPADIDGVFMRNGPNPKFPRIDDRLTGRRHQYLTTGAASGAHQLTRGEHDRLIRWDMDAGTHQAWDTDASIGEVIFVPRQHSAGELDGYYMSLARGLADDRSWLYIWDAGDFPAPRRRRSKSPPSSPTACTPTGSRWR